MDDVHPWIYCCVFLTDSTTAIGGAVIDQNNPKSPVALRQDRLNTCPEVGLDLVDSYNDCQSGICGVKVRDQEQSYL